MTHALLISVRFHDGRYHGKGDWPPSPARLFQALVAAAALPGLDDAKREALRWLEQLDAPTVAAPAALQAKTNVGLFVPNNDLDAMGGDVRRIGDIRSAKHVRPRLFDAAVPLHYIWRLDGKESHAECICDIANGLYQLGRGVDMAWAVGELTDEKGAEELLKDYPGAFYRPSKGGTGLALGCPCPGSLASLEKRHKANAHRFSRVNGKTQFAKAPGPRFRAIPYNSPPARLLFELRYTTAPGAPFAPWPLESAAKLVQELRDRVVAKFARLKSGSPLDEGTISKVLIGRGATEADKALRICIIPIPSIGHIHAHPGIRRVLVEAPPDCPVRPDDLAWGFAGLEVVAPVCDQKTGEILSSPVELAQAEDDSMLAHYGVGEENAARLWRSVTPLALPKDTKRRRNPPPDSHEGAKGGKEHVDEEPCVCHAVLQALRHAGRRQKAVGIRVQREPFSARGERAETFAGGTRFSGRRLRHVEIEFAEAVSGPLILGNGRYSGLGLMAPVQQAEGVQAFEILDGLSADANPFQLANALRRAVMARAQEYLQTPLPTFFCGHEADGHPSRASTSSHLAFAFDPARTRLLILAPHLLDRRSATCEERENLTILDRALKGMHELRAGRSGLLALRRRIVDPERDPLFAPAQEWVSVTPYQVTRHAHTGDAHKALALDLKAQLQLRAFPDAEVLPLDCQGVAGKGLEGIATLKFKLALKGPLVLGRSRFQGGGLFAGKR